MNVNDLIKSLIRQKENLQEFLNTILLHQREMIGRNIDGMEKAVLREEQLLSQLDQIEKETTEVIKKLAHIFSVPGHSPKLSDLITALEKKKAKEVNQVIQLKETIVILIDRINKANDQNKLLIETSRNFIKDTIYAVMGSLKKSILDRRV